MVSSLTLADSDWLPGAGEESNVKPLTFELVSSLFMHTCAMQVSMRNAKAFKCIFLGDV